MTNKINKQKTSDSKSEPQTEKYYTYVLECADGSLYTGITNDIERRLKVHNSGKGAKYTRGRLPVKIVYKEEAASKGEALTRERQIKKLKRDEKIKLINNQI